MAVNFIYLVRPAHTVSQVTGCLGHPRPDPSLSATGKSQATQLAEQIAAKRVAVIYSSPALRAVMTSLAISKRTGAAVYLRRTLRELDYGTWEGMTWGDVIRADYATYRKFLAAKDPEFPGGESYHTLQTRIVATLERIAKAYENSRIVVVSHSQANRAAIAHYRQLPLRRLCDIDQSPACFNVLRYDYEERPRMQVMSVNRRCDCDVAG